MRPPLRIVSLALAALLGGTLARGADPVAGPNGDLALTFFVEDGPGGSGDAVMDAGRVSAAWNRGESAPAGAPPSATVERRVGVRVASRSGRGGFARLRAFVESPDPRVVVSVDGAVLTSAPRLVDAHAPIGSTVGHRVRIEVPAPSPPGAFASRIVWEVEEQ